MEILVTPEQMKEADRKTSEEMYVSSDVLMERAAIQCLLAMDKAFPGASRVLLVCGPGNNGGDGFALGRLLMERGVRPVFVLIGGEEKCSELEKKQLRSLRALKSDLEILPQVPSGFFDVVVDALFGVSLNREVAGSFAEAVKSINALKEKGAGILSIDVPSGIDALSGKVLGTAVRADLTVACGYVKIGTVLFPGAAFSGDVVKAPIGITEKALPEGEYLYALKENEIRLPKRRDNTHKGSYGKVLLVAGSRDISGAAVLAGRAALKSGAGMVKVFTHEANRTIVGTALPEALVGVYASGEGKEELEEKLSEAIRWADVIALGPGLSTGREAEILTQACLETHGEKPLVLDADGINILAGHREWLGKAGDNTVLTPHMAEMSRLTGLPVSEIKADPVGTVRRFLDQRHTNVILKDARTIIGDSKKGIYVNLNGNNGLATAGSGDVLTGLTAGILAQQHGVPRNEGKEEPSVYALSAAIHGRSGDRAAKALGLHGLCASELPDYFGDPGNEGEPEGLLLAGRKRAAERGYHE